MKWKLWKLDKSSIYFLTNGDGWIYIRSDNGLWVSTWFPHGRGDKTVSLIANNYREIK